MAKEKAEKFLELVPEMDELTGWDPMDELGTTGLRQFSGILDEEFLPQLRGTQALRIFREMRDNDPIVGAMLFAIEMLIRQVEWRVDPASSDSGDLEAAEFLRTNMNDMEQSWDDTIASILSFLPYGFSLHEEVYKRRNGKEGKDPTQKSNYKDGRIGWRKLPVRAQDTILRWLIYESELLGFVQLAPPDFKRRIVPREKFLHFRTTIHKGNPEGRSVLRNAYRPWYFKKRIEEVEGIGVERDLAGLPVALVPPELLQTSAPIEMQTLYTNLKKMVRNIKRDEREGVVYPLAYDKNGNLAYDLKLLTTGGRRQFDTTKIIDRYDSRIAMTVLADFILMGHQRVGSFALSSDKTHIFATAIGSWVEMIASAPSLARRR